MSNLQETTQTRLQLGIWSNDSFFGISLKMEWEDWKKILVKQHIHLQEAAMTTG